MLLGSKRHTDDIDIVVDIDGSEIVSLKTRIAALNPDFKTSTTLQSSSSLPMPSRGLSPLLPTPSM